MSEDIHKWSDGRYVLMFDEHTFFVWDNERDERMCALEVTKRLNEQQATISALKEENEQLRENLHNCRLNKNIIREKLKLWQDAHKEYNIYSIKDFEESFELDAKINKEKGI